MDTRINKFVAQATGMSRRRVDQLIDEGKVNVNGSPASLGYMVSSNDNVTLNGQSVSINKTITLMLNKPVGYVCSRVGQGSKTIYELIPSKYSILKPVGRLDKDSSGLILLTNDGNLALNLTHPRYYKEKIYRIKLDKPLLPGDANQITEEGVKLSDGISKFILSQIDGNSLQVTMHEGRNRQIRRTFEAIGYRVIDLHRLKIGDYSLGNLGLGQYEQV